MKQKVWLVCDKRGIRRLIKRNPRFFRDEVGIALTITIPDSVFNSLTVPLSVEVPESLTVETESAA